MIEEALPNKHLGIFKSLKFNPDQRLKIRRSLLVFIMKLVRAWAEFIIEEKYERYSNVFDFLA